MSRPLLESLGTSDPEPLEELTPVEVRRSLGITGLKQAFQLEGIDLKTIRPDLQILTLNADRSVQKPPYGIESLRERMSRLG